MNDVRNGIKLLNFRSVTVFAGDLAQCGHMMALKAVHELEKTQTLNFGLVFINVAAILLKLRFSEKA